MPTLNRIQPGLLLLLSLMALIVLHPVLDQGVIRLFMQLMIFVPVLLATIRLSEIKHRVWPRGFSDVGLDDFRRGCRVLASPRASNNEMGIVCCVLRTDGCRPVFLSEECPLGYRGSPLYRDQYLSAPRNAMVLSVVRHRYLLPGLHSSP